MTSIDRFGMVLAHARVLRAQIRLEGMKAANRQREISGESPAFVEEQFQAIIDEERINESQLKELIEFGSCSEEFEAGK